MRFRTVKGNDCLISHHFFESDEETPSDADGVVTVTIEREDGTTLAGGVGTSLETGSGAYSYALVASSHTSEIDMLKVTWTCLVDSQAISEVDYVKVVGGRYFPLHSLRAMKGMSNTSTYTNAELQAARDIAEEFVENATESVFVKTYRRETKDGDNCDYTQLERVGSSRIISVKIDGVVQDTTDWTLTEQGLLRTTGERFTSNTPAGQNVEIQYEWGVDAPNRDLERATITLARYILLQAESTIPDRARLMQTEWAMFHLDTASEEHPTGLPEVDSVIMRYRMDQPGWVIS